MRTLVLAFLLGLICFIAIPEARDSNEELLKIVVLTRHGVRAPTQDAKLLELWSQKSWPVWPVERGWLTPRGAELVTAMWSNLRSQLEALPGGDYIGKVYVRADVDERTKATASAIIKGLDRNIGFHIADKKIDPLFHPVKAGLYKYDPIAVATDVLAMTHGGLERLQEEFSGAISLIGDISGTAAPALCSRFALMPKCYISDLPNAISVSPDGTGIRLVGSLGIASSLAEIFLLEYGEWPNEQAGWGEVDGRVLSQILPIHSKVFDVVNRAEVVAWANGSALLKEMGQALFGTHYDKAINEARLIIFVGHDTNIANVSGLLNIEWQATGYPPNGIPPAGALFLELWRKNGKNVVIPRFYAQPPQVLHAAFEEDGQPTPVSKHAAKAVSVYEDMDLASYPAEKFKSIIASAIEGAPSVGVQPLMLLAAEADKK